MSDARVQFHRYYGAGGPASVGQEQCFSFRCPKDNLCGRMIIAGKTDVPRNGKNEDGGTAQWDWDGNRDAPTFKPSIDCSGCWHGFIEKGRCVDVSKNDEPEPPVRT